MVVVIDVYPDWVVFLFAYSLPVHYVCSYQRYGLGCMARAPHIISSVVTIVVPRNLFVVVAHSSCYARIVRFLPILPQFLFFLCVATVSV